MTADQYVASAGANAPQSWNRYTYVLGDPINFKDPTGRFECGDDGDPEDCDDDGGGGGGFCGFGFHFDPAAGDCEPDGGGGGQPPQQPTSTCPDGTSPISGTLYTCIHQSGGDWKQFLLDLNDIAKALKKDTNCERFLTSGGTSLSTVFADLSNPKKFSARPGHTYDAEYASCRHN